MSVILTDQGFVEIGGELTHWDRGYIKKGHKWITRKMKNGKWVYTYKKAKDLKNRAEKAREDLEKGGHLDSSNIDGTMKTAIRNHESADKYKAFSRRASANMTRNKVKDEAAREKAIKSGVNSAHKIMQYGNKTQKSANYNYQKAEDMKRMQNSARRAVQKENSTHVVKNKINDWLKKRRKSKIKVTYSEATLS